MCAGRPPNRPHATWQIPISYAVRDILVGLGVRVYVWSYEVEQQPRSLMNYVLTYLSGEIAESGEFMRSQDGQLIDEKIYEDSPRFRTP